MDTKHAILSLISKSLKDGVITLDDLNNAVDSTLSRRVGFGTGWDPYGAPHRRAAPQNFSFPPKKRFRTNGGKRFKGTFRSYSEKNGYGFISTTDKEVKELYPESKDIFLHRNQYEELLQQNIYPRAGQTVEFSIEKKDGKPQARDIEVT